MAKYGGTLFTLKPEEKEGQFCGVFAYQQHAQLSFSAGATLDDPQKLLKGSGRIRRHINFTEIKRNDLQYIKQLLIQASNG